MSKSTDAPGDEFIFSSKGDAETFVRTLMEHRGFCYWCLAPLEVNPIVQFPDEPEGWPLETAKTFDEYGCPVDDVPPDRTDDQGRLIEPSRDEKTICGNCGVLDTGPGYSRSKETTRQALAHVHSILKENGVIMNPMIADLAVTGALDDRRTGQFCQVLGEAIYYALES